MGATQRNRLGRTNDDARSTVEEERASSWISAAVDQCFRVEAERASTCCRAYQAGFGAKFSSLGVAEP